MKDADLGRLATIRPDGAPQVSPVGFTYNEELGTIDIFGYNMSRSAKYRNITCNENGDGAFRALSTTGRVAVHAIDCRQGISSN